MVPGLQGQNMFGAYPDKSGPVAQLIGKITSGRSAARLAHHVRDVGVGCSNHLAPTLASKFVQFGGFFVFRTHL